MLILDVCIDMVERKKEKERKERNKERKKEHTIDTSFLKCLIQIYQKLIFKVCTVNPSSLDSEQLPSTTKQTLTGCRKRKSCIQT